MIARERRLPRRTRDEMRDAIEARIREQARLDVELERELAAALGVTPLHPQDGHRWGAHDAGGTSLVGWLWRRITRRAGRAQ